jgi:hypothetical protein
VTETEVLQRILGPGGLTNDRRADLITAIKRREALIKDIPLELRILYHGLYSELLPENEDVWLRVGIAAGWPAKTAKDRAWRRAHPRGKETEPPDPSILARLSGTAPEGDTAAGEITD